MKREQAQLSPDLADLADLTLGEALHRAAARWPDAPALLSPARTLSWAALDAEVDQLCGLLTEVGVRPGDAVAFLLHKRPEVVTGFLACARVGAIMTPINYKLSPDRIGDTFSSALARAAFIEPDLAALLPQGDAALSLNKLISVGGAVAGARSYGEITAFPAVKPDWQARPDQPCYYNYTSGTTGKPKGAVTSHRNILANAISTIDGMGFRGDDVFLGMFSVFSHPHELFHRSILVGGPFLVLDTFSPRVVSDAVGRWGVTWMMAVPSFYEMMLDYADQRGDDAVGWPSLRRLEAGGAYVGPETISRMEAAFHAEFVPVWGATEVTGVAIANGPGDRRPGSTGRALPGYSLRVVDEDENPLPPGEVGELLLRGPALATSYVGNPDETAALFRDGWYHTRDLVQIDEDGWVFFAGRRSEMLKIGGLRVYPLEIEITLRAHPGVRDAVVVRAEDRLRGELARAVIQPSPGSAVDVPELRAWCRERLGQYKIPKIVEFWSELPRLPNGKIDRRGVESQPVDPRRDDRNADRSVDPSGVLPG